MRLSRQAVPFHRAGSSLHRIVKFRIFAALALTGLLSFACGTVRADDRILRVSLNTELQVLDPIVTTINATRVFAYLVFDTLVGIDREGHYHPQMLEGWQISDDRLSYTFRFATVWFGTTPRRSPRGIALPRSGAGRSGSRSAGN